LSQKIRQESRKTESRPRFGFARPAHPEENS